MRAVLNRTGARFGSLPLWSRILMALATAGTLWMLAGLLTMRLYWVLEGLPLTLSLWFACWASHVAAGRGCHRGWWAVTGFLFPVSGVLGARWAIPGRPWRNALLVGSIWLGSALLLGLLLGLLIAALDLPERSGDIMAALADSPWFRSRAFERSLPP